MPRALEISVGQHSDKGRKEINQDFHGALIPAEPLLTTKGIAIVIADGISSSSVSQIASESAVKSFLTDYYCTSDSWSVKTSAQRVIAATNSWLHAQTRRSQYAYQRDRGYVCTLSAMVLKAAAAHIFHIGDSRIYRVAGTALEQLTEDHRVVISSEQNYLSRALGINAQVEIDYRQLPVEAGDIFVLATDGVYEFVAARTLVQRIAEHPRDLDAAARAIVEDALARGSDDNLTVQIVRIENAGSQDAKSVFQPTELPPAPLLEPRTVFEGYRIVREIHASSRSHIYLAIDGDVNELVALKIPSIDLRSDPDYLRRFMMEEWVARRVDSPHILKPRLQTRKRSYLYTVTEFIEGATLAQWMIDHPTPDLETVRNIVEQIAAGLRAFHRMEMLHQDLRPENIMIDNTGTAKIIDFGSVRVAGVREASPLPEGEEILGTVQYTAPEYFLGGPASPRSDLFSLAVIAYQMLTGSLPYGAGLARARTRAQFRKLRYRPAQNEQRAIPSWMDAALQKALQIDPANRYEAISQFVFDLRKPNPAFDAPLSLMERDPLRFWQYLSLSLFAAIVVLLAYIHFGAN